jgi:Fic family protein
MARFLQAFNEDAGEDRLLKAGVADFHFITIHPFEDGNGRIARAITDLALARADRARERFYSMSARIEAERDDYYDILERSQKGGADITDWLFWFLSCLGRSFDVAERQWNKTFRRARFWENANRFSPNERQRQVLSLLWEGFEGHLTSGKYAKIAKCSPDSALRDLLNLVAHGLLRKAPEGGRSTHYLLVDESGK